MGLRFLGRSSRKHATARVAGRRRAGVAVEALEGRTLLTGTIADIATLPPSFTAGVMTVAPGGRLWFAEQGRADGPALGSQSPTGARIDVALPASDAGGTIVGVAADASGNVWYALQTAPGTGGVAGKIGRVGPDGSVTEFYLPLTVDLPVAMTIGPDGNPWVAVHNPSSGWSIDRVGPDGAATPFPVVGATNLMWLTAGPDQNLWFVDGQKIGKMTTEGVVTEFTLTAPANGPAVDLTHAQLTAGSDGNIWFLGLGGLSKITPDGTVSTMTTPDTKLDSLSRGSDGNLYISFLPSPTSPLGGNPGAVVARVATDGQTFILPDRVDATGTVVAAMASGNDASVWLNEGGGKLGRIFLGGLPMITPPVVTPVNIGTLQTRPDGTLLGIVGSFSANYSNAEAGDFQVTIDWGDGHVSAGTVQQNSSGAFDILGANRYTAAPGTVEKIQFHITGPNGASATTFEVVTVAGPTPRAVKPASPKAKAVALATAKAKAKAAHPRLKPQPAKPAAPHVRNVLHPRGPAARRA
jgi:hypothetical protein